MISFDPSIRKEHLIGKKAFADIALGTIGAERNLNGSLQIGELRTAFGWKSLNNIFVLLYVNNALFGLKGTQVESNSTGGNQFCDACHTQQDSTRIQFTTFSFEPMTIGYRLCQGLNCDNFISGVEKPYIVTGHKVDNPPADERRLSTLEFWTNLLIRLYPTLNL